MKTLESNANPKIKNTTSEMKNFLVGLSAEWKRLRKESVNPMDYLKEEQQLITANSK